MEPGPPIVLATDFGLSDPYVGVMKGVILGINPRAVIIDLTHGIQPQNLRQAAFVLRSSHDFFPPGAIHVVVVDPGVGTERKAVLLVTPRSRFLAPDNGVLSYVLAEHSDNRSQESDSVPVPPGCTAYELGNPTFWRYPVSNTFHGRDIFAPVAAHLSLGVEPAALGQRVSELARLPVSLPAREGDHIRGEVIYADHFGNLITNIPGSWLEAEGGAMVEIKGRRIFGLRRTYHDASGPAGEGLLALVGSHGHLEIAVADGSAARKLEAVAGEPVAVLLRA